MQFQHVKPNLRFSFCLKNFFHTTFFCVVVLVVLATDGLFAKGFHSFQAHRKSPLCESRPPVFPNQGGIENQFSPEAQALLNQAITEDKPRYDFTVSKGAQILPTSDGKSFYVLWEPNPTTTTSPKMIMIALHGSHSYAFDEFYLWYPSLAKHGIGILALQWWFGKAETNEQYYTPGQMYPFVESFLRQKGYQPGTVMMQGFSRGSANSYAMTFYDRDTKNNFFGMTFALSGKMELNYPLYAEIDSGKFGKIFTGTHWGTFCGGKDPDPNRTGCPGMEETAGLIKKYGGTVDLVFEVPELGHGGFNWDESRPDQLFTFFKKLVGSSSNSKPVVTVKSPNGGEIVKAGSELSINWTSTDDIGVTAHNIDLSTDGGKAYATPLTVGLSGAATSFVAALPPAIVSTAARVRVTALDARGETGSDESDANFSIVAPTGDVIPPTIKVLSPNGGEKLKAGSSFLVTWQSSDNLGVVSQDVLLSTDGGATYPIPLAVGLPGTAQSMMFNLSPAQTKSKTGRIRVVVMDQAGNRAQDESDGNFSIKKK